MIPDLPLEAVPINGDPPFRVRIEPTYHLSDNNIPIEFPVSPWNGRPARCVALVNNEGLLIGGVSNSDYKSYFYVRNVGCNDSPPAVVKERRDRLESRFKALRRLPDPVL